VAAAGPSSAGATAAAFPEDGFNGPLFGVDTTGITWPAANVPATRLDSLPVDAINVATNGTVPAVDQAGTVLENAWVMWERRSEWNCRVGSRPSASRSAANLRSIADSPIRGRAQMATARQCRRGPAVAGSR
jgi:hypothetical protein